MKFSYVAIAPVQGCYVQVGGQYLIFYDEKLVTTLKPWNNLIQQYIVPAPVMWLIHQKITAC